MENIYISAEKSFLLRVKTFCGDGKHLSAEKSSNDFFPQRKHLFRGEKVRKNINKFIKKNVPYGPPYDTDDLNIIDVILLLSRMNGSETEVI